MATKRLEKVMGTFAKAAEDEPLFVLRAQDDGASAMVREWAKRFMARHQKKGTTGKELGLAIIKHAEALEIADAMDAWPIKKQAD